MEKQGRGKQRALFTQGPRGPRRHLGSAARADPGLDWLMVGCVLEKSRYMVEGKGQEGIACGRDVPQNLPAL